MLRTQGLHTQGHLETLYGCCFATVVQPHNNNVHLQVRVVYVCGVGECSNVLQLQVELLLLEGMHLNKPFDHSALGNQAAFGRSP